MALLRIQSAHGRRNSAAAHMVPTMRPFASAGTSRAHRSRVAGTTPRAHPVVTTPSGDKINMQATMTVGTSDTCSVQIPQTDGNVAAMHAELFTRGARVFCRPLVGEADDLKAHSYTWLFESELRPGVDYMLSPAASLSFGAQGDNTVVVDFEENSEGSAMSRMMMGAMASGASEEVRDRFSED
eukprot:jgi/Ulvmu1/11641/UM008_0045.1